MSFIKNFAFFWVGKDITIPQYLVNSINKIYSNDVKIFMLTNNETPYIEGVSQVIRKTLPKNIMLARLKAYGQLKLHEQVLYLDADSLVLNKVEKFKNAGELNLFLREKKGLEINYNYPEFYPEFIDKTFDEMMPYLFGAIVTNSKDSFKNFNILLNIAKKLPDRFHRWYGDQFSLKLAIDENLIKFKEFNFEDFISIVRDENDISNIKNSIVTFKGLQAKPLIEKIYKYYNN